MRLNPFTHVPWSLDVNTTTCGATKGRFVVRLWRHPFKSGNRKRRRWNKSVSCPLLVGGRSHTPTPLYFFLTFALYQGFDRNKCPFINLWLYNHWQIQLNWYSYIFRNVNIIHITYVTYYIAEIWLNESFSNFRAWISKRFRCYFSKIIYFSRNKGFLFFLL